ncbi:TonB-dependent receptor [Porticoccaceae bacterium]|jgi:outer membrane receptor protein involved in Fe transport|nr:TonB-dependent receptor [Porticoccaceae bacterium]
MTISNQSEKRISLKQKLIVTSVSSALGLAMAPLTWGAEASLEEVIVTARQRAESSQDVPMTIDTVSGEDIQKQGITTLQDFSRFVSGLNVTTTAAGQNTIVFRGVSDGGGFLVDPTAAIYLDEQAMSMTSMAPDIYPVDIARIEALSGPQSTLFGASSQTGTIRVITNKPDASGDEASGNIGIGLSTVKGGDAGHDFDATLNIPLIEDKLAVRFSAFSAEDGGFIDNVLGNTVVDEYSGAGGLKNNANMVEKDINNVEWSGARASAKWLISDDWSSTLTHNYQKIEANGFNDMDASVGDLETIKFYDEFRNDKWEQTSLVIDGDLGFAQLTVAASYYDRETLYQHDTQSYAAYFMYTIGVYAGYATYDFGADPVGYLTNDQVNTSKTLEVRLTNSTDKLSWTAGMFFMDSDEHWDFYSYTDDYGDSPAYAAWSAYAAYYNVTISPDAAWWYSGQSTTREDKAIFGEMDINLSERLSLLVGGRWYEVDRNIEYMVEKPSGFANLSTPPRDALDDGFTPKVGLQYDLTDNMMVWGVYSEGYRVGGTNRGRGIPTLPVNYESDIIENMELGLKSTWMDDTVQVNATFYDMVWKDMQLEVTDPSFAIGEPWQAVVANLGDATVKGMDISITAVLNENIQMGFSLTRIFDAYVNTPESFPDDRFDGGQASLGLDPKSDLPMFADTSYSFYIEYSDQLSFLGGGEGYARLQHSFEGTSLNQLGDGDPAPQQENGDYRLTDLILGYDMGDWKAQLSLNNISDERGVTYRDSSDFDPFYGRNSDNIVRPRNYNFSIRRFF